MRAMDQLHAQIPNFDLSGINVQFLKHLRIPERKATAEESFEQQKKVLQHLQDGVELQDALQAACPGVGYRFIAAARGQRCSETEEHWHQEFAHRFSVLKDIASSRTWSASPEGDSSLAATTHVQAPEGVCHATARSLAGLGAAHRARSTSRNSVARGVAQRRTRSLGAHQVRSELQNLQRRQGRRHQPPEEDHHPCHLESSSSPRGLAHRCRPPRARVVDGEQHHLQEFCREAQLLFGTTCRRREPTAAMDPHRKALAEDAWPRSRGAPVAVPTGGIWRH